MEKKRESNSFSPPSVSSDYCSGGEGRGGRRGEGREEEMKAEVQAEKISSRAKPRWAGG